MSTTDDELENNNILSFWTKVDEFTNILSCSSLAVTFYVYYLLIPTRLTEDDCLLNMAGNLCLSYVARLFDYYKRDKLIPEICLANEYMVHFFTLCSFAWYASFMYFVSKQYGSASNVDDNQFMKQLRYFSYGVPAIIMIILILHEGLESSCHYREEFYDLTFVHLPMLMAIGMNCFFTCRLAEHTGTTSLLTLNHRLFVAFGLPWILNIIFNKLIKFLHDDLELFESWLFLDTLTNATGFLVALILIMSRARVWKCITRKYSNIEWLQKWQPSDEESSPVTDSGIANLSKTFPSEI